VADRRLLLLENAETALAVTSIDLHSEVTARPTNLRSGRYLPFATDKGRLPDVSLEYMGETLTTLLEGATDVDERGVQVGVRVRVSVADGDTPDVALLPLLSWVELALLGVDFTLSGVALYGELQRIEALKEQELADWFVGCRMVFVFTVPTKRADPRQAP
jgi:hypothetical protein